MSECAGLVAELREKACFGLDGPQRIQKAADAIEALERELAWLREVAERLPQIKHFIRRAMEHPSNNDNWWNDGHRLLAALDAAESEAE